MSNQTKPENDVFHNFIACFSPLQATLSRLEMAASANPHDEDVGAALHNLKRLIDHMSGVRSQMAEQRAENGLLVGPLG